MMAQPTSPSRVVCYMLARYAFARAEHATCNLSNTHHLA